MQNFIDQAIKNGITLSKIGKCQFCGADYQKGIFNCMDNYNYGTELIDYTKTENVVFKFLSVDAHALQHPEIHGRWSNHFHLTRLHLILEKNQNWDYKKSPLLSNYLNEYKLSKPNEFLIPPKPLERGNLTAKDVFNATTSELCLELVKKWASEVYNSWHSNHLLVSDIGIGFLNLNS